MTTTLTAPYGEIVETFNRLAHTRPSRPVLPVLAYAKLADGIIYSTDLEGTTVLNTGGFKVDGDACLLPIEATRKALRGIRGSLTPRKAEFEQVTITSTPGPGQYGSIVTVTAFGRTLQVCDDALTEVEDYPAAPNLQGESTVFASVDAGQLAAALTFVNVARGDDDTLPMLTAIRVEGVAPATLSFAATDRYRLAVTECGAAAVADDWGFLLPGSYVAAVKALHGTVVISRTENTVIFADNTEAVVVRPLEASFPTYRSLIPTVDLTSWTVDRRGLIEDVAASSSVLDKHASVKISFDAGLHVHGNAARSAVRFGEASGTTAFNPKFLTAGLKAFDADTVTISATSSVKPHMIRGHRPGGGDGYECLYLIMPVRLPESERAVA